MILHSRHDYIRLPLVYLLIVGVTVLLAYLSSSANSNSIGIIESANKEQKTFTFKKEVFKDIQVEARAYVVYDIIRGEVIASKNAHTALPLASITKVMTALSALVHNNKATAITITDKSIDGTYDLGLKNSQVWSLGELLKYTLVFSSNDGALAIADALGGRHMFVEQMNKDAQMFGLPLTFTDPAGLDVGLLLGGEGSALSVAKMFAITYKRYPDIFDVTTQKRATVTASTGKLTGVPNTNQLVDTLVEIEASKTGFTNSAGGNLAVIVDVTLGRPVAIVVLGSTREERFVDVEKLYKALKESITP